MPKKKQVKEIDIQSLSNRGLAIIEAEIAKIEAGKVAELIDHKAAATLNDYLRTLISMKREDRQVKMQEELERLSDNDLDSLAKQAVTYLEKVDNGTKAK